jgi:hypothetical protein
MTDGSAIRTRPWLVALLVWLSVTLVLAGCGGSDDEASVAATDDTAQSDAPTDDAVDEPAVEESSGDDTSEDTAEPAPAASGGEQMLVVTIGDTTYEADLSADLTVCISMGGAVGATGPIPGVDGGNVSIDIPPEDYETSTDDGWEPPSVRVDLGEDENGVPVDFRAGGEVVATFPDLAGMSQVDSFSVDGTSASGTATFIDFFQVQLAQGGSVDQPQSVQGTFAVSCG